MANNPDVIRAGDAAHDEIVAIYFLFSG